MSRRSPLDQDQVTVAGQSWQGDGGGEEEEEEEERGGDGRWRLKWLDEHQYNASVLLLRGLLIFSMFFRIMSCNVTFRRRKEKMV